VAISKTTLRLKRPVENVGSDVCGTKEGESGGEEKKQRKISQRTEESRLLVLLLEVVVVGVVRAVRSVVKGEAPGVGLGAGAVSQNGERVSFRSFAERTFSITFSNRWKKGRDVRNIIGETLKLGSRALLPCWVGKWVSPRSPKGREKGRKRTGPPAVGVRRAIVCEIEWKAKGGGDRRRRIERRREIGKVQEAEGKGEKDEVRTRFPSRRLHPRITPSQSRRSVEKRRSRSWALLRDARRGRWRKMRGGEKGSKQTVDAGEIAGRL
jgi:hypothetical protein